VSNTSGYDSIPKSGALVRPDGYGTPWKRERAASNVMIGVFIFFVLIVYVYPLLNLVNVSLKTSTEFMLDPVGITSSFRVQNYVDVVVKNDFLRNFLNSIYYLAAANLLTLSFTALAAFVISRRYVGFAGFFYVLFLMGIFLPDPLIPQFYLLNAIGLYNTPIGYILLKANPGIIMLLMVGYYRTIPKTFDEAAALDGCGITRYLTTFVFPMSRPIFASAAILFSVGVWNDIIGTTIFLTSPRYYPVIRALFSFVGQYGTNWPPLAAAVFIVAAPLIVIFLFFQKYIISSIVSGGMKG
jgi:raffinose/stachyose/melibiose transport system permease protein